MRSVHRGCGWRGRTISQLRLQRVSKEGFDDRIMPRLRKQSLEAGTMPNRASARSHIGIGGADSAFEVMPTGPRQSAGGGRSEAVTLPSSMGPASPLKAR